MGRKRLPSEDKNILLIEEGDGIGKSGKGGAGRKPTGVNFEKPYIKIRDKAA